jgi:ribonuclease PH
MPSEAAAQHEREQRIKYLTQGVLQQQLQRIFSSVILGNEGTQILFDFTVIECDQDLLQALVNCAAGALLSSKFQLKCVPTAVTVLLKKGGAEYAIDPTLEAITSMRQHYTHKLFSVMDSQKQEFIFTSLTPLSWSQG